MALPSNINVVTVTGTYVDATGTALAGTVTFSMPDELADSAQSAFIDPSPIVEILDVNGHFSTSLICTDNTVITPIGWQYTVTENIKGLRSYQIALPHTLTSPVDLSSLVPPTGA